MIESEIKFTIPGVPVAKGRTKSFRRGNFVGHYTPEKTVNYENLVKLVSSEAMAGRSPIDGAVKMSMVLYFPIPKSFSKKKRDMAINRELLPLVKPDCDNVQKCICDAMNNIVYHDDKQVYQIMVMKFYGETPRAEVVVKGKAA